MNSLQVLRPDSLTQASQWMLAQQLDGAQPRWLAGGQSLLAAMKLGMSAPSVLLDLQSIASLREIRMVDDATLLTGAMVSHARMADSSVIQGFCAGLANLAGGIADAQVRNMGTLGGSLANNDPAACWPTAVLACNAKVLTAQRAIPADDFFAGLYTTALQPGELLTAVRWPKPLAFHYLKFEQPASRFALTGVAVARFAHGVRVAMTGLGHGVVRWPAAEQALSAHWSVHALDGLAFPADQASSDLHASAAYRAHLAGVLTRRAVAALTGEPSAAPVRTAVPVPADAADGGFGGSKHLTADGATVWQALLDPVVLQRCIPGCESLTLLGEQRYQAQVRVGLGPVSARFASTVSLQDLRAPHSLALRFEGSAGALGGGRGTAQVTLRPEAGGTRLDWRAQVQTSGRIAQFGNRLLEATSRKLSEEFFAALTRCLNGTAAPLPWWRRAWQQLMNLIAH
jgi:CO/xanthine dehydrogenase FAD-binding subunit/carbon monoxide dehydrogenase subunit G